MMLHNLWSNISIYSNILSKGYPPRETCLRGGKWTFLGGTNMTHYEKKRDFIFSFIATALSIILLMQAYTYSPESSGFPKFLLGFMLICSVYLLIKSIRVKVRDSSVVSTEVGELLASLRVALCVIGGTIAYALAIQYIGYFVSTSLFFLIIMIGYGKNAVWLSVASSGGFMLTMYVLFVWFLGMRLPEGLLF